ncbi:serine kinase [Luteibacter anthropi]|uniref:Serine kinase n=1 Tax=Luteibacter anthropi TaxID=564369 RepID=A0A7X5U7Y5_9GAMM|nr:serine kinase [Luteibacter anthropi]NII05550.1 serine kinase [Luteibacter anthropi]URX61789.1 serine kinase [Luteibacter anthropi]
MTRPEPIQRTDDLRGDPFREHNAPRARMRRSILGADIVFESDSRGLMKLVELAYGDLPEHRFSPDAPWLRIDLRVISRSEGIAADEPPPVQTHSGAGLLCGMMDACNYAVVVPAQRKALVVVSSDMLEQHPYHVRYELIEFAVFLLTSRVLSLVPLHGACVGRGRRGVLLLGESGAGKSTLSLHGWLQGLDFLAEDAVFVRPDDLLATGVGNFLHLRDEACRFVHDERTRAWIRESPTIRRRSGVRKYEADLRHGPGRLAASPLTLTGIVLVSSRTASDPSRLLKPLPTEDIPALLAADQPYATAQEGWTHFTYACQRLGMYRLERGRHPDDGVSALSALLG